MSNITLQKVDKSYGALRVIESIDMDIASGEFIVILGPSGCGKSTLLNIIAGLDDFSSGRIEVNGVDVGKLEPSQRGLSMVFQSYALFPTMSVRRNLSYGMQIAGVPKAKVAERVDWVAGLLQIGPLLDRRPAQLSGGQRQRVAIGRALVRSSQICLFDEPLSNLDAKLRTETRMELKQLHHALKTTIVYVTHDQIEAMTMADRVAVMNRGKIEQFDKPQSLYERPATLFVAGFVGTPMMNFWDGELTGRLFETAGRVIDLAHYAFRGQDANGGEDPKHRLESKLGVRAEDIQVVPLDTPQALPARHALTELLGSEALVWFDCLGKRVSVKMTVADSGSVSKDVGLRLDVGRASIFDSVTGYRV